MVQFLNNFKMIPSYDLVWDGLHDPMRFIKPHYDINATSQILSMKMSFKWRPFIEDKLLVDLMAMAKRERRIDFILMGYCIS